MVTFLITSLFIISLLAVAVYYWQKPNSPTETERLPAEPQRRSLFEATEIRHRNVSQSLSESERNEILARARAGDKKVLKDAQNSKDSSLHQETLNLLVAEAQGPQLLSLVSYVCRNELPVNTSLAKKFIESWKSAPNRNSTAEMLHIAALSDDATTYRDAVEAAIVCWSKGHLSTLSAEELRAIIDGEFWILSSNTRSSGAGFSLKQTLASARRELEAARSQNPDASG